MEKWRKQNLGSVHTNRSPRRLGQATQSGSARCVTQVGTGLLLNSTEICSFQPTKLDKIDIVGSVEILRS